MTKSTWILLALTLAAGLASLTAGAADISLAAVLTGDAEALHVLLASRLPRLAAVLCTGVGMSIAGLIMQQLCANKFVSPTTGATISSAQLGILIALLFFPDSASGRARRLRFSRRLPVPGFLCGLFCGSP